MIARALTVVALLACLGCDTHPYVVPSPLPATMRLTVYVLETNRQPIAGALVRIDPSIPVTTDESGLAWFRIIYRDLPTTRLIVSKAGYRGAEQRITVGSVDQTVVILLER